MMLKLTLSLLILPFLYVVVKDLWEVRNSFFWTHPINVGQELKALEKVLSNDCWEDEFGVPSAQVTFLKKDEELIVHSYDGKTIASQKKECLQHIPNTFIHYQKKYWVNANFIKRIKKDSLELLNGINIPDKE